jgi:hypothetical protein
MHSVFLSHSVPFRARASYVSRLYRRIELKQRFIVAVVVVVVVSIYSSSIDVYNRRPSNILISLDTF